MEDRHTKAQSGGIINIRYFQSWHKMFSIATLRPYCWTYIQSEYILFHAHCGHDINCEHNSICFDSLKNFYNFLIMYSYFILPSYELHSR